MELWQLQVLVYYSLVFEPEGLKALWCHRAMTSDNVRSTDSTVVSLIPCSTFLAAATLKKKVPFPQCSFF